MCLRTLLDLLQHVCGFAIQLLTRMTTLSKLRRPMLIVPSCSPWLGFRLWSPSCAQEWLCKSRISLNIRPSHITYDMSRYLQVFGSPPQIKQHRMNHPRISIIILLACYGNIFLLSFMKHIFLTYLETFDIFRRDFPLYPSQETKKSKDTNRDFSDE